MSLDWHLPAIIVTHALLTCWAYYIGARRGAEHVEKQIWEVLADDEVTQE